MNAYKPPTTAEMRTLLDAYGLTYKAAAALLCCSERSVGHYLGGSQGTRCPYPVLFTLTARCTTVQLLPDAWRHQLRHFLAITEEVSA